MNRRDFLKATAATAVCMGLPAKAEPELATGELGGCCGITWHLANDSTITFADVGEARDHLEANAIRPVSGYYAWVPDRGWIG